MRIQPEKFQCSIMITREDLALNIFNMLPYRFIFDEKNNILLNYPAHDKIILIFRI